MEHVVITSLTQKRICQRNDEYAKRHAPQQNERFSKVIEGEFYNPYLP